MKKVFFLFLMSAGAFAQVGINTTSPKATLDVQAISYSSVPNGVLIPRVKRSQAATIATANVQEATMIYVNTLDGAASGSTANITAVGFYYYGNTTWLPMSNSDTGFKPVRSIENIGDIKYGMSKADHAGWYLLDGRPVSGITSANAKQAAADLGFTTNLPDATDRFIKQITSLNVGETGGSNSASFTLNLENLPSFTLNATTASAGSHTHTVNQGFDMPQRVDNNAFGPGTTNTDVLYHGFNFGNLTVNQAGNHNHTATIQSGGKSTPVNVPTRDWYFTANAFIYLGN